mmetsp:Transcript_19147/g.40340  ORF Transcript_19147/g.40340 Transcript_19147/m.40340 type:complete len:582 (-) Transcript_19147:522-2267(-)
MSTQKPSWEIRRRLSFASNLGSRQDLYHSIFNRKQQIIACQLFFDDSKCGSAPDIDQIHEIVDTLGSRFERLRGIPTDLVDKHGNRTGHRVFRDVGDWSAACQKIVLDVPLEGDTKDEARLFIEQVKLKDILPEEDGVEVPLWRIYRVGCRSLVVCVDHCIGDGLSLASLLAVIATDSSNKALRLEDVSPLFDAFSKLKWWQMMIIQWAFLLPLNFLRCIKYLKKMISKPTEPMSPLMPEGMEEFIKTKQVEKIPQEKYGAVYLPPVPVSLLKSLSKGKDANITVSDVLVTLVGDTVRRYFHLVGYTRENPIHFGVPVAIPVKPINHYLDDSDGLNSVYTPTGHMLPLTKSLSFSDLLDTMHESFQLVKNSYITSFMLCIFRLLSLFTKPDDMVKDMKKGAGNATFVWSNVPGPRAPVFIKGHCVSEIQCVVSNPFTMMQTCSYNGMVYTNIQVDTRTAIKSELLSQAHTESMKAAIQELLLTESEQGNALRTLEEAVSGHNPGPFLSRVKEEDVSIAKETSNEMGNCGKSSGQRNAMKTLEEAESGHNLGPLLSRVKEENASIAKETSNGMDSSGQSLAQ